MMEFMLSRVTMGACGILLLAAAMVPLTSVCQDAQDDEMQIQADAIASMVDSFGDSDLDSMTVSCIDILPSDCTLSFGNNTVCLKGHGKEFSSASFYSISSGEEFGPLDEMSFSRSENGVKVIRTVR